jgi:protein-disulfide isomerase
MTPDQMQSKAAAFFELLTSRKGLTLAVPAVLLLGAAVMVGRTKVAPVAVPVASVAAPTAVAASAPSVPALAPAVPTVAAVPTPAAPTPAAPAATVLASGPGAFSPDQRGQIEAIVKAYLLNNPEVMVEIQQTLEAKMEKIQAEKMTVALQESSVELFRSPTAPIAGNPKGDVTVVEFFDYNCGYCKKAFIDIAAAAEKDKGLKLVLKEFPILSKGSEEAAKVALAAKMQGKYWEFHRAMLESQGQANEASALKVAEKLGLNIAKLKIDLASAEVKKEIDDTRKLAAKLGIQGTPHFLVGERPIGGAPDGLAELLVQTAAEIRKAGGCKVC